MLSLANRPARCLRSWSLRDLTGSSPFNKKANKKTALLGGFFVEEPNGLDASNLSDILTLLVRYICSAIAKLFLSQH